MAQYIPEVVDGTFKALEDPSHSVKEITLSVLNEMLLKLDPTNSEEVSFKMWGLCIHNSILKEII